MRDPATQQVSKVTNREPQGLVYRWMKELSNAAAWLESIGYAHCDIRPANILLDDEDHLKLADFDRTAKVGDSLEVGTAPFARLLGQEGGVDRGTYGDAGPRTEQFAVGLVFYLLTSGHDPYQDQWLGENHGPKMMDLLQNMIFPSADHSELDTLIQKCWLGGFDSIEILSDEMM